MIKHDNTFAIFNFLNKDDQAESEQVALAMHNSVRDELSRRHAAEESDKADIQKALELSINNDEQVRNARCDPQGASSWVWQYLWPKGVPAEKVAQEEENVRKDAAPQPEAEAAEQKQIAQKRRSSETVGTAVGNLFTDFKETLAGSNHLLKK